MVGGIRMDKLKEIVKALEEGKKIRRRTWSENSCWKLKDGVLTNNKGEQVDNWEIAEEHPEPVRVFLGKTIHPGFTEEDESEYYLKEEVDAKIKKYFEETNYNGFVEWVKREYPLTIHNYMVFCKEVANKIFGKIIGV